jgi:hypothetical protein
MAYIPNMIRILTHGVDWWHHGLRVGERKLKSLMEPPQGEERKRKKKNRGRKKREAVGLLVSQSRQFIRCDGSHGVTQPSGKGGDIVEPSCTMCTSTTFL